MKTVVIYDDTGRKSEVIKDIIGNKGFGEVIVKKKSLEEYYRGEIREKYPDLIWKKIHSTYEFADLIKELELAYSSQECRVMHCFSNYIVSEPYIAGLSFE